MTSVRPCCDFCNLTTPRIPYCYCTLLLCPAPNRRALSNDAVWHLSVAYIGPKLRTDKPRKTKIGTEVAHVTRDSDTTFKIKRSRSPGRFTHRGVNASGSCSGGNVLTVGTYCHVADCRRGRLGGARRFGAHGGRRGPGTYCGGSCTACYYYYYY